MEQTVLPALINAGIYDAEAVHKNCIETRNRGVSVFELDLSIEQGGISYINGIGYPITPATLICGKPGQVRRTRLPFRCYYLHLMVESGAFYDALSALPDCFTLNDPKKYVDLFCSIIPVFAQPFDGSEIYLARKLSELVYALYKEHKTTEVIQGSGNPLLKKALRFMDLHYTEKLTLEDIAAELSINPIYFQRLFTRTLGQSPRQYLLTKRLSLAKRLLLSSEPFLPAIAEQAGFSSTSYFCHVFKKELGMTPMEYRKEVSGNYPE